ncbi:MAG: hypothetical protein ACOC16_04000 [Nanoarchaeota archaeon]
MKLTPKYSFEYNCILNQHFTQKMQIENYASLISDKDRFLPMLKYLENNSKLIEKKLGYTLKNEIEFYIVRAEKFKSFSEPITIEYSILTQEMLLFLLKEIAKTSIQDRFLDEISREVCINNFCEYIITNGKFNNLGIIKFTKNLHDYSKQLYPDYKYIKINFQNKTIKQYIESTYDEKY